MRDDGLFPSRQRTLRFISLNAIWIWYCCPHTWLNLFQFSAQQFDTDLTPRKSSIKLIIQEELTKLADEADDEEDEEGDAEKDETQSTGQEVEAWEQDGTWLLWNAVVIICLLT